jgi:hypothetical protein
MKLTKINRIISQYPETISLTRRRRMLNAQSQPKTKTAPVPLYAAGFFMDPYWLFDEYLPRFGVKHVRDVIPIALMRHSDKL